MAVNGILLVDKPAGWTSHDVVAKLRGLYRERRIGHSGTLDPMATGLLVVFIGRATRAVQFAENHVKEYLAGLHLGITTDTQDTTGTVIDRCAVSAGESELNAVLASFRGEINQLPPMYSAVKIDGKKLYESARKGIEIERKPRRIEISRLELTGRDGDDWLLSVRCSKGTYIRTLCSDIGDKLGCGGAMSSLRRLTCGAFCLDDAKTMEQIELACREGRGEELLLPTDSLFFGLPAIEIDPACEKKCRTGAEFSVRCAEGSYRVYSETGEFLMLGECRKGRMKTIKNFFEVK